MIIGIRTVKLTAHNPYLPWLCPKPGWHVPILRYGYDIARLVCSHSQVWVWHSPACLFPLLRYGYDIARLALLTWSWDSPNFVGGAPCVPQPAALSSSVHTEECGTSTCLASESSIPTLAAVVAAPIRRLCPARTDVLGCPGTGESGWWNCWTKPGLVVGTLLHLLKGPGHDPLLAR